MIVSSRPAWATLWDRVTKTKTNKNKAPTFKKKTNFQTEFKNTEKRSYTLAQVGFTPHIQGWSQ
jgi:hypothetical protein